MNVKLIAATILAGLALAAVATLVKAPLAMPLLFGGLLLAEIGVIGAMWAVE